MRCKLKDGGKVKMEECVLCHFILQYHSEKREEEKLASKAVKR